MVWARVILKEKWTDVKYVLKEGRVRLIEWRSWGGSERKYRINNDLHVFGLNKLMW